MGRTIPSFRLALEMEKEDWRPFRNALDKSDRKEFDEMFDIPRFYLSTCSNSVHLVPLHPVSMSILFHHYKELNQCIKEVEQMKGAAARSTPVRKLVEKEERKRKCQTYSHGVRLKVQK